MSTRGSMSLEQFNDMFRHVYFPSLDKIEEPMEVDVRRRIVRVLESLGYCEFDFEGRKVFMCKPSLMLLPFFGLPKVVLTGARSPSLIQKLKESVRNRRNKAVLQYFPYTGADAVIPSTLYIEAINIETIQEIARDVRIACETSQPSAWVLANISSSLDNIKELLNFESQPELNWKRRVFSKDRLVFSEFERSNEPSYLAEYKDPISKQLHHFLWHYKLVAQVERDWGRYIILEEANLNILLYDEKLQNLAVPITVPLPCILARAVAMCTGIAPFLATTCSKKIGAIPPEYPVQVYSGITKVIAVLVAGKLCQKLIYTNFDIEDGRGTLCLTR